MAWSMHDWTYGVPLPSRFMAYLNSSGAGQLKQVSPADAWMILLDLGEQLGCKVQASIGWCSHLLREANGSSGTTSSSVLIVSSSIMPCCTYRGDEKPCCWWRVLRVHSWSVTTHHWSVAKSAMYVYSCGTHTNRSSKLPCVLLSTVKPCWCVRGIAGSQRKHVWHVNGRPPSMSTVSA